MDQVRNHRRDRCLSCSSKDINYFFDDSHEKISYFCQKCEHVDSLPLNGDTGNLSLTNSGGFCREESRNLTAPPTCTLPCNNGGAIERTAPNDDCRCEFSCRCGNQLPEHFIHHELDPSFHIVECAHCLYRREFGQFRKGSQASNVEISDARGDILENGQTRGKEAILICRGCGNMNVETFVDLLEDGRVTGKQCGWCDESIPILTEGFRTEQVFLSSPCSVCQNQKPDSFLYTCGSDGLIRTKECRICSHADSNQPTNYDVTPVVNNLQEARSDGVIIIEESCSNDQLVNSLHHSVFLCPNCGNNDLYKFNVREIKDELFVDCDGCHEKINLGDFLSFSEIQNGSSPSPTSESQLAECSCGVGKGDYTFHKDERDNITNVVCRLCHDYVPLYHYATGKDHSLDKIGYPCPRTKITSVHQLRPGDHIMYQREIGYFHHQIIVDVFHKTGKERLGNNAKVIHYTGLEREGQTDRSSVASISPSSGQIKGEILEEDIRIDLDRDTVYRIDYPKGVCYDADEVIRRANSRLREKKYDLLKNNCEHFARWCKTGERRSLQAEQVMGWATQTVTSRGAINAFCKAGEKLTVNAIAKSGASKGAQQVAKQAVSKVAGGAAIIAVEALHAITDISKARKQLEQGHITKKQFLEKKSVYQYKAIGGATGAIAGGAVGSVIPIFGSFIGSSIGGIVGNLLGVMLGSSVNESKKQKSA